MLSEIQIIIALVIALISGLLALRLGTALYV